MPHNLIIVGILTVGFALASFFGYVMQRIHFPLILGYLLAGYIIGPYSPGFVANSEIAEQLAEIGVILMLFGVGLHFKLEDLWRVKNIAIPGAVLQTFAATVFATLIVYSLGWSLKAGLIIGLSTGVASTVVLVRQLMDHNILNTLKGHIAVGWLIVEDIFTVAILILLPTLADLSFGHDISWLSVVGEIFFVLGKFFVLVFVMFTIGHKCIEYILKNVARLRSQELFTLSILALVFLIATGSAVIFGTSIALGAFIAGMVIGKTNVRHQASANALPLKDIFSVIFFLSVGMLFNPAAISEYLFLFLGIIAVILIVKPLAAYLITVFLGYPVNIALTVAVALAQIGEFSFILAEEAMNLKILPDEGFDLLVACALVSISLNPLFFKMIHIFEAWIHKNQSKQNPEVIENKKFCKLPKKVLVVGFGPAGRAIVATLKQLKIVPQIIEENIDTVSLQERENAILFGDASLDNILKSAHIEEASHLIITVPNMEKAVKIIHAAKHANPHISIVTRAQYISEKALFDELQVDYVCTEEETTHAFVALVKKLFK
ncbi:MAG TPA: cation:proton antiporter [Parachlamydiaceae bacterium]|nr:cation:proton antiporter [Parachlamydiaceae bacterium]